MKVRIQQRSVYHKYAEVEVEIPNNIKEDDISDYLIEIEGYEYHATIKAPLSN